MKIYISEKDQSKYVYYYGGGRESIECRSASEPMVVKSLEEHEAEIRRPLEEEIERLKKENKQLIKDNRLLDKTKYTAQQDDIDFFVEQERQKVIAELQKFENEHRLRARKISKEYPTENEEQKARLYALSAGRFDILGELKQKLKEMRSKVMIDLQTIASEMTTAKLKRDIERIERQIVTFKHCKEDWEFHKRYLEAYKHTLAWRSSTITTLKLKKKLDYLLPRVYREIEKYGERKTVEEVLNESTKTKGKI